MSLSDLCTNYITTAKLKDETEKNVIEFAEAPWGLGLGSSPELPPLYPVQRYILKAAYNIPLDNIDKRIIIKDRFNEKERFQFTELEYHHFLYEEGRVNLKEISGDPTDFRPNLVLVIGRRGTKSSTISILTCFETYRLIKKISPQQYYHIMPDQEIRISSIATNQEQAAELFRMITGHLERAEYFKKYRNKPTLNYMQINTQRDLDQYSGHRPSLRIVASPCSARGIRGRNNIVVILDEMAHFFEDQSSVDRSDEGIYEAVTPSVARFNSPEGDPHGRIICISSPAGRRGKFFEMFQRSMDPECKDLLMIRAPTWEVDYTLSSKFLRAKYADNPNSFNCEFGADFSERRTAWIENEQILRMNIIPGLKMKPVSFERIPHFMGIDVGFKEDGTAIVIGHIVRKEWSGGARDCIELDYCEARYPGVEGKEYFAPEEMAEWIATFKDKFFIVKGIMDQYYGLSVLPVLHARGFKQIEAVHFHRELNSQVYQNLMAKMLDGSLRIPEDEEHEINGRKTKELPLIKELLSLQATMHSKYLISVEAPEIKGMHDDLSDAYVRMVWEATQYMNSGGSTRNMVTSTQSAGASGMSYRRYYLKQKAVADFTRRPTMALQNSIYRERYMGASRFGGGSAVLRRSGR